MKSVGAAINAACIYTVLVLVNIAYLPGILLTDTYDVIIIAIIALMIIALLVGLSRDWFDAVKLYLGYGIYVALLGFAVYLAAGVAIFDATYAVFLAITCALLGYVAASHDKRFLSRCSKTFILSALFLGLYSVYFNQGGFYIAEQYSFDIKNSSGPLLGTAIILSVFLLIDPEVKANRKPLWAVITLALMACLLTFRSRTTIVGVAVVLLVVLYRKGLVRRFFSAPYTMVITAAVVAIIVLLLPTEFIYDAMFANHGDLTDADNLLSGRLSSYEVSMGIFAQNPWLGGASLHVPKGGADNFVIGHLGRYGILGALLVFPPYILAWVICVKGILRNRIEEAYPYCCLLLMLVTSLTEMPYPFGPGTPVMCTWFLIGWKHKADKIVRNT